MRGNIQRRGKNSWRLKIDIGRDANGKRLYDRTTVQGKRADAEAKLNDMLAAIGKGAHVKTSRVTVAEWVNQRLDAWVAAKEIGGTTEEGYRDAVARYVVPYLGTRTVQSLKPLDLERWHHKLRAKGLSARTISGAHKVLGKALREAAKYDVVVKNVTSAPAGGQAPPSVPRTEMQILSEPEVADLLAKLDKRHQSRRGRPIQLGRTFRTKIILALFTGIRRGELLALRWRNADHEAGVLKIREALEETKLYGLRFKSTKTGAGRRDITLPDIAADALREHRREQLEVRMRMGAGRLSGDDLLFPALNGGPQSPNNLSGDWREFRLGAKVADIGFHNLRHTHASMLIASGVDIVEISKRLGHADPAITLRVYAHLFRADDSRSAAAINAALARLTS
jgi:integrase